MDNLKISDLVDELVDAAKEYGECRGGLTYAGDRVPDRLAVALEKARENLMNALTANHDSEG